MMELEQLTIPVLLAILTGGIIKRLPNEIIHTKLAPIVILLSQFFGRLALEFAAPEVSASVFGAAFKAVGPHLEQVFWQSAISTIMAVGVHSGGKNTKQAGPLFLKFLRGFAAAKAVEGAAVVAEKATTQAEKDLADVPKPPTTP